MTTTEERKADKARTRLNRTGGWNFGIRTIAVAIFDALALLAAPSLISNGLWVLLAMLIGVAALVNWAYLSPRTQAARWLTPGLVMMAIFVVFPVIYTFYISTTNWATGNVLTKEQVLERLVDVPLPASEGDLTASLAVYRAGDELALLIYGEGVEPYLGIPRDRAEEAGEAQPVDLGGAEITADSLPATIGDYELLEGLAVAPLAGELQELALDLPDGTVATVETLTSAAVSAGGGRFVYDADTDVLTDQLLDVQCPAGEGFFLCDAVPEEEVSQAARSREGSTITCDGGLCDDVPQFAIDGSLPGWRTVVGADNYVDIFTNERIRAPFLRVLIWNIVFAGGTVLLAFAMGLGLALILKDERLRGRAFYRSIFILPYAIPAFLSIFVWRGLLSTEFGKVNELLGSVGLPQPDWLGTTAGAMIAVLLVNLWLGFPYMFLITSGALTSIPEDLLEAARVDGASAWRSFRAITLPLLLVSTAPLLIGAFAFNFNNFALIYLLTQGGPPLSGYDVPIGGTDILITFTFDLAQGAGRGAQFGLSSAIIVVIFVVLATVSASSFRLTKRLEEIYEK